MISVIVPAYNVGKYLDKCMESLVQQTLKDIEIIIVVDGATDDTYDKARAWEKTDSRVLVILQDNAGSGPARNNGLSHAKGEFIVFVDPDDWVDREMVEDLFNDIIKKNVDLVTSGCNIEYFDAEMWISSEKEVFDEFYSDDSSEIRKKYFELFNMGALSAPTKKIYRKSIIDKYEIAFPALRRSQDIVFNYRYFEHISSVFVSNKVYYHYRVDNKENQRKIQYTYYKSISYIYKDIKRFSIEWGIDTNDKEYQKCCLHFFDALISVLKFNANKKNILEIIKDQYIQALVKDTKMPNMKMEILKLLILSKSVMLVFYGMKLNTLINTGKRNYLCR